MLTDNNSLSASSSTGILRISANKTLLLFFFCWIFSWVIGLVAIGFVGGETVTRMRAAVLLQDVLIFILPVVLTVLIAAWHPWRFIGVDRAPTGHSLITTLVTMVVAIPAMNCIVAWNNGIHFPDSMAELERVLRLFESSAGTMIDSLLGGIGVGDLVISILIIGVLTGVSEELFFRGALQSILMRMFRNKHVAIWVAAIVFSTIHMQFFGFVPRMLLGAFFGYLYWWSGSIWLSVAAHAFNNSLVVLTMWLAQRGFDSVAFDSIGTTLCASDVIMIIVSLALTYVLIWYMYRHLPLMRNSGK
jgi:hypothetical protein